MCLDISLLFISVDTLINYIYLLQNNIILTFNLLPNLYFLSNTDSTNIWEINNLYEYTSELYLITCNI